jgi:hypothetical protein
MSIVGERSVWLGTGLLSIPYPPRSALVARIASWEFVSSAVIANTSVAEVASIKLCYR